RERGPAERAHHKDPDNERAFADHARRVHEARFRLFFHELPLPDDSTEDPCAAVKGTTVAGRATAPRAYCASTSALLPKAAMEPFACSTSILSMSVSTFGRCATTMIVTPSLFSSAIVW